MEDDPDGTVRLSRPRAGWRWPRGVVAGVVVGVLAAGGGWLVLRPVVPVGVVAGGAPGGMAEAAGGRAGEGGPAGGGVLAFAPAGLGESRPGVVPGGAPGAGTAGGRAGEVAVPGGRVLAFAPAGPGESRPGVVPGGALAGPPLMTEAEVLAAAPRGVEAYRFAPAPEIHILQFGSLAEQARTLNRAAALIEKAGYPRDRVLGEAELDRRIRAEGALPDSFYYGHDYRAADLVRFMGLLRAQGLPLNPQEEALRRMMEAWGWTAGSNAALISLVAADKAAGIGAEVRATVLRHELSHGLYFTSPAYARYSRQFWQTTLTEAERGRFGAFLASEGYDTGIEDLVVNEMQAYLMHTADVRFFSARAVGIPEVRLDVLRGLFLVGMPPGWLRDCTTVPGRAPRRRGVPGGRRVLPRGWVYRNSAVRRTRMVAERRVPARVTAARAARSSVS